MAFISLSCEQESCSWCGYALSPFALLLLLRGREVCLLEKKVFGNTTTIELEGFVTRSAEVCRVS